MGKGSHRAIRESVMPRKPGAIICDAERMPAAHRYDGSSPRNGGERSVEARRRWWPRWLRFFGL